jgi:uncharacterized protein
VTTDYVLDETLTLLRSRRGLDAAIAFIDKIRKSNSVRVYWIDEGVFERALDLLRHSDHKSWSFTDCTSFALMKGLSVTEAFTFDRRFEEAGLGAYP